ncbi:fimbria/pilus outer membrane usher protein [Escherichia coli]
MTKDEYGTRWRLRYSNYLNSGLSFLFSGEEYESKGFNTLSDTFNSWCNNDKKCIHQNYEKPSLRSQLSVSLNQSFNSYGNITFSGSKRDYWGGENKSLNYSFGYSNSIPFGGLLNLNWSRSKFFVSRAHEKNDYITSLWLSFPLGKKVYSSYQVINQARGKNDQTLGLYGDILNRQLHWDIRERYHHEVSNTKTSSSLRVSYKGTYGEVGGNYSYDKNIRQMGANLQGNLLLTKEGGLIASQEQGDTLALISIPGVSGAKVGYWAGVNTDFRGYTTSGYLQPYNRNRIYINPLSLPSDVSLSENETNVVPTKGAVVMAKLTANIGAKALIHIKRPDGASVPFGSVVSIDKDGSGSGSGSGSGIVDEDGSVYLSGIPMNTATKINVIWGRNNDQRCTANLLISETKPVSGIYNLTTQCVM